MSFGTQLPRPVARACALVAFARALSAQAPPAPPPFGRDVALASFDSVWRVVRDTHYDSTFKGVDWVAVRDELRPRAAAAHDAAALREVLGAMLARLGDSHYGVIPAHALTADAEDPDAGVGRPGEVGLDARLVDGKIIVARVEVGSAAARAGVRPGWAIERVDTLAPQSLVTTAMNAGAGLPRRVAAVRAALTVERQLAGDAGTAVRVRFVDGRGAIVTRTLVRDDVSTDVVRIGSLPPLAGRVSAQRVESGGMCIGVVRLTAWLPTLAAPFERALRGVRDCRGIVLDLRGNLGGVAAMVMGTAGWFTSTPDTLGVLRMRQATLRYVAVPQLVTGDGQRVDPYAGPLAILVDRHSASTSEIFAAGLQGTGRARIVGDTTAGQALPATFLRLPDGDVFIYAVADFVSAAGLRIEGRGVVPDDIRPLTRIDLLAGRDAALEAALRWIQARSTHRTATP